MKAVWNGEIIAESDKTINIEGNHYFPPESVKKTFLVESDLHTTCPWKGVASYYHIEIGSKRNQNAAWYYPDTKPAADGIENYIAFWNGVEIID